MTGPEAREPYSLLLRTPHTVYKSRHKHCRHEEESLKSSWGRASGFIWLDVTRLRLVWACGLRLERALGDGTGLDPDRRLTEDGCRKQIQPSEHQHKSARMWASGRLTACFPKNR